MSSTEQTAAEIHTDVRLETTPYHPTIHKSSNAEYVSLIHLEAPPLPESAKEDDRKPLQISAVLDVSGSMRGEKLKLAKEALAFLVSELGPKDKFGLVTFASDVVEDQRPTAMTATGKAMMVKTVGALGTRGYTNLSGGLLTGIAQASGDGSSAVAIDPQSAPSGRRRPLRQMNVRPPMQQQQQMPMRLQQAPAPGLFARMKAMITPSSAQSAQPVQQQQQQQQQQQLQPPTVPTSPTSSQPNNQITETTTNEAGTSITFAPPAPKETEATPAAAVKPTDDRHRRVVLLFTDGQANEGITGLEALTEATKKCLSEQPHDVTVFTFGFGADHDATLLRGLAECSGGSYYYIQSARDMKEIFADCLGGLLSVVAEKIQILVKPLTTAGAPCRVATVATHFPVEQAPDGTFTVRVKDLYAEEKRDILVTIAVDTSKCEVGQALPLAHIALAYQNPSTQASVEREAVIQTVVADGGAYSGPVNEQVDEQLARYKAVEAMKVAQKCADEGDLKGARLALDKQVAATAAMRCANSAFGQGIAEELRSALKDAENESHYREVGQKRMAMKQSAHAQQRSNAIDMMEQNCQMYTTSAKRSMRKKGSAFSFK